MTPVVLRFPCAAALSALLAASPALSSELQAESHIDAVTVFPSEAAIVRRGAVTLQPGEHIVHVSGLPANLDPASVRVEAEAPFGLDIGTVDLHRIEPAPLPIGERSDIERQIAALEADRAVAEDARAVGEARLRMAERLATAGGQGVADGLREGRFNAQLLRDVVAAASAEQESAFAAMRGAKARIRDLDLDIGRLRAKLETQPDAASPTVAAAITVVSRGTGTVALKLEYRIAGAGWTPVYEARLTSATAVAKPSISFALRANVEQDTGEDWRDVALTLSTTRPARGTDAGTLPVIVGRFGPPPRPMQPAAAAPAPESFSAKRALAVDAAPAPMQVAREIGADLVQAGTIISYRVPGRVSVTARGEVKTLKVADERVEPTVVSRAVPKLAPSAYVTASFRRAGPDGLLPGRVQLYRDGVYVGAGQIEATPAGEPVKLGFGEDPRLKLDYAPLKTEEGETGTFTTQRLERRDTRITLRNLGAEPVSAAIEDQMPVSEMTDLKIEPLASNTPPSQSNLEGRRGSVAWTVELKPGETREIRFGWAARWPTDKPLIWQPVQK